MRNKTNGSDRSENGSRGTSRLTRQRLTRWKRVSKLDALGDGTEGREQRNKGTKYKGKVGTIRKDALGPDAFPHVWKRVRCPDAFPFPFCSFLSCCFFLFPFRRLLTRFQRVRRLTCFQRVTVRNSPFSLRSDPFVLFRIPACSA